MKSAAIWTRARRKTSIVMRLTITSSSKPMKNTSTVARARSSHSQKTNSVDHRQPLSSNRWKVELRS
jgi:hypothetical protein